MCRLLIGLILFALATAASAAEPWQWRGPAPVTQWNQCNPKPSYMREDPRAVSIGSTLTSKDGRYSSTIVTTSIDLDRMRAVYATPASQRGEACMRKAGYVLDRAIARPWDNAEYMADYRSYCGCDAPDPIEVQRAREAEAQRDAIEAAITPDERARQAQAHRESETEAQREISAQCARMTVEERATATARRIGCR